MALSGKAYLEERAEATNINQLWQCGIGEAERGCRSRCALTKIKEVIP